MRKMVLFLMAASMAICFMGCSEEQLQTVETTYKVGESAVKTFVPVETREELGLKEKNEFIKDIYGEIKPSISEAKE